MLYCFADVINIREKVGNGLLVKLYVRSSFVGDVISCGNEVKELKGRDLTSDWDGHRTEVVWAWVI